MTYYAIQYDLHYASEVDYQKLWNEMDRLGAAKYQESAYFLDINATAGELLQHLKAFIHKEDFLMIVPFTQRPRYTFALIPGHQWVMARFG